MNLAKKLSILALAGLMVFDPAVSQSPVSLSNFPLGSTTNATPNLIFGIDDSATMDYEVLLQTKDGALWADISSTATTATRFWSATGALHTNSADSASYLRYGYLFPNGSGGAGSDQRQQGDTSTSPTFAVPPLKELAFLRSSTYNPLYYNPAVRYSEWPTAIIDGAVKSFPAATATIAAAARSHPVFPTSGSPTTFNLTTNVPSSNAANWTFRALPGMVIPTASGTVVKRVFTIATGLWSAWPPSPLSTSPATVTVPAGEYWDVAMPYDPTSYWTATACNPIGDDCQLAPDGAKLKRTDIAPTITSYPKVAARTDCVGTTCTYAEEMKNFTNWFQYYRKRRPGLRTRQRERDSWRDRVFQQPRRYRQRVDVRLRFDYARRHYPCQQR
jgi:type IV pilus assembly protein PilY1